jgi:hypothetical protein
MDKTTFTPEESFLLITQTIEETKKRFEQNGHILIFWGILTFIVTLSQHFLIQMGLAHKTGLPALLYPLGGIYTFIYAWKAYRKNNLPKTIIGDIIGALGAFVGANLLILGFFFSQKLGEAMAAIFLILLAILIFIAGTSIKFKPLIIGAIVLNIIGFATFYFDWQYHPLLMSIGSIIAFLVPGLLLNRNKRKKHV